MRGEGTKTAGLYRRTVPARGNVVIRVRLSAGEHRSDSLIELDGVFSWRFSRDGCFLC